MAKQRSQPAQPFIGTLTEADFEVLRWVVQDAKSRRINTQSKSQEQFDHQAPEVYVGITLSEIPALTNKPTHTGTGSGTGAEGDTAGKGNCRLIRIMKSDDTLDRLPNKVEAFNISGSSIPKNQEVLLARDKFGNWLVVVGGGTPNPRVRFSISSVDCMTGIAHATVLSRSKGASYPPIGSSIVVCDPSGCFLIGSAILLNGRTGWAEEQEGVNCSASGTGTSTGTGTGSDESSWSIYSLCYPDIQC